MVCLPRETSRPGKSSSRRKPWPGCSRPRTAPSFWHAHTAIGSPAPWHCRRGCLAPRSPERRSPAKRLTTPTFPTSATCSPAKMLPAARTRPKQQLQKQLSFPVRRGAAKYTAPRPASKPTAATGMRCSAPAPLTTPITRWCASRGTPARQTTSSSWRGVRWLGRYRAGRATGAMQRPLRYRFDASMGGPGGMPSPPGTAIRSFDSSASSLWPIRSDCSKRRLWPSGTGTTPSPALSTRNSSAGWWAPLSSTTSGFRCGRP
mmetsp:Transcript_410/g.913  ORF Transcript_410/g.913 Transcript_410/m.913 type:complete len:261 (+) Transcript_410:161-943(+)